MTLPYRYGVYGIVLAVDRPLQSLEPVEGATAPAVSLSFVPPGSLGAEVPPGRVTLPEGHWIAHGFLPDGRFYLNAPDVVEAIVSADGRTATCASIGTADARAVEANLLNIVLGTALTLQGEEPLHATALDLGGRAVALLGQSGAGKSTLAAALVRRGATLLSDDVLRIEFAAGRALAHPGPYRLKLVEDSARQLMPDALTSGYFNPLSHKMIVTPPGARASRTGVALAALLYLGDLPGLAPPAGVEAIRLTGLQATRVLISSAMDDRNASPGRLARQLAFVGRLAAAVPIHALRYPRRFDLVDEVAAAVRRIAAP